MRRNCDVCDDNSLLNFSKWRYEHPGDREKVARLALTAVLRHTELDEGLLMMGQDRGLARALLQLSATGDRAIQVRINIILNQF